MTNKTLTPTLSVSLQIRPHQVAPLAKAGSKSVIFNQPTCQCGLGQPGSGQIAAAAKAVGIHAAGRPVVPGQAGLAEAAACHDLLARLPIPNIAFCRSGNRSASLWSMQQMTRA